MEKIKKKTFESEKGKVNTHTHTKQNTAEYNNIHTVDMKGHCYISFHVCAVVINRATAFFVVVVVILPVFICMCIVSVPLPHTFIQLCHVFNICIYPIIL